MAQADDRAPMLVDIEEFPDPYVLLRAVRDAAGHIVDFAYAAANQAAILEMERPRDEVLGSTLLSLDPRAVGGVLFDDFVRVVEDDATLSLEDLEYARARPDRTPRFYDVTASKSGDGVLCAWWDVTVRYEAAREVAAAEARFRATLDSLLDPHQTLAPVRDAAGEVVDFEYVQVNRAACSYLGRAREELLGRTLRSVWSGPALAVVLGWARSVFETGEPVSLDGQPVMVRDGVVRMIDVRGVLVGGAVSFTFRDVTDRVRQAREIAESREHFRLLAENASDVVLRASVDARLVWVSPSVADVLGWTPEDLLGTSILDFVEPDDIPADLLLERDNADSIDFVARVRTAGGAPLWMDIDVRPLLEDGRLIGRVGRLRDVQAEHDAQEALRRSEQRFRTAMESAPTGMAVVGLNREFLEVNPALCRLLGRTEDWLLTHTLGDVLDPLDDDLDRRLRSQVLAGVVPSMTRDHQMVRSDGERVLVEQSIGLLRDDAGRATAYVSQFADVTEARETRERLRFLATHDPLTELLNRRELVTRIAGVLGQTPRTGVDVGVLFIDLDGLKPINDTYGHTVGDEVIVTVARRIRGQVRSNDVLARFGGDEFVLVLPAIHGVADAERIAGSLHSAVQLPMTIEGRRIGITLSIGVAVVRPGEEPDIAMRRADTALYRAKREGRARTVVYDPGRDGD